jgi:hypothetical protein
LAVKPRDDKDVFVREVDEELRRERVGNFVERYGTYLIIGALLLLAAVGGWMWWRHSQNVAAGGLSEKLVQADEQLSQNNAKGAAEKIDELVNSDRQGYRLAGLFLRANAQEATNSIPAAIETLKQIAADGEAPQPYRDAALIRQTLLEFETLPPEQVIERMRPFAAAGNAWHGTAGEMVGIALMRQQKNTEAGRVFEAIARDRSVPDTIRQRAIQIVSTLGIDAVQVEPSIAEVQQDGQGAAPGAVPEAVPPAGAPDPNASGQDATARNQAGPPKQ